MERANKQELKRRVDWFTLATWVFAAVAAIVVLAFVFYYYLDHYHSPSSDQTVGPSGQLEQRVHDNKASAEDRIALAKYYIQQGKYDEAAALAQGVLKGNQTDESALATLGLALFLKGDYTASWQAFAKVATMAEKGEYRSLDVNLQASYYYLGRIALERQEYDKAVAELRESVRVSPSDADSQCALGLAYLGLNDADSAMKAFQEALRFDPKYPEALIGLGRAYELKGLPESALGNFRKALELEPDNREAKEAVARLVRE